VKRHKRDYISLADLESERPLTREKRIQNINIYEDASNAINNENYGAVQKQIFNDELWEQQWYLVITIYNIRIFSCIFPNL